MTQTTTENIDNIPPSCPTCERLILTRSRTCSHCGQMTHLLCKCKCMPEIEVRRREPGTRKRTTATTTNTLNINAEEIEHESMVETNQKATEVQVKETQIHSTCPKFMDAGQLFHQNGDKIDNCGSQQSSGRAKAVRLWNSIWTAEVRGTSPRTTQ